jgi:hypothetical protein
MEELYYPPEMKTDDNGYRMIVRACGTPLSREKQVYNPKTKELDTIKLDPEPFRLQSYEKLGLDPNEKPTLKLGSVYSYLDKYNKEHPSADGKQVHNYQFDRQPFWTLDDYPMLKDWLDENTAGLDLLGEAVRKPVFRIPFTRENENSSAAECLLDLEMVQLTRDWARAASARARYRLGIGDIDGAIDDIVTIHHLGRHAGQQGMLMSWLVGIAFDGMGYAIGIGSNPEFPPTKEQIERLVAELNTLPPHWTLSDVIEAERLYGLGSYQDIYWANSPLFPGGPLPGTLYPYMSWTLDINIVLERANKVYDVLIGKSMTLDGKDLEEIIPKPSWNPLQLLTASGRTNRFVDQMTALLIPAMQASREAFKRIECTDNMQRLTLALLLYEKDHGTLPEGDWREAVKPYLGDHAEKYFRCPSHPKLAEGETAYVMIGGVPNPIASPNQILLVEVLQPQKLGEGDGRFPYEKADVWRKTMQPLPDDFNGLGSYHPGGLVVGYRSGAVSFMSSSISPEKLQSLLDGTATTLP